MSGTDDARSVVAAALGVEPVALPDDARIGSIDRWDSLAHMRLLLAVEEAIGHQLSSEQAVAIESLSDVAALLEAPRRSG